MDDEDTGVDLSVVDSSVVVDRVVVTTTHVLLCMTYPCIHKLQLFASDKRYGDLHFVHIELLHSSQFGSEQTHLPLETFMPSMHSKHTLLVLHCLHPLTLQGTHEAFR
ncbi:MAG: hypothetical protein EBU84_07440 [Actinobacteria bacterium]|nr:hypothetical protein [Actinomycetota bacterium]